MQFVKSDLLRLSGGQVHHGEHPDKDKGVGQHLNAHPLKKAAIETSASVETS